MYHPFPYFHLNNKTVKAAYLSNFLIQYLFMYSSLYKRNLVYYCKFEYLAIRM